jgi:hypothetical protein
MSDRTAAQPSGRGSRTLFRTTPIGRIDTGSRGTARRPIPSRRVIQSRNRSHNDIMARA